MLLIKVSGPELQGLGGFGLLVDILPAELRQHTVERRIAAFAPESVERNMMRGTQRMVRGAHHRAEGGDGKAAPPCMVFAQIEKAMPDPLPAAVRQKHRFGAVEDIRERQSAVFEGGGEILGMFAHRRSGRGADEPVAIEGPHEHRAIAVAVGLQV